MSVQEKSLTIFESEPGSPLYQQRTWLEKIQNVLLKFGLTPNQAKVYIYLAKVGPKPAVEIVKALKFPRTETYFILGGLQERRIVKETLSSPAEFVPLPLEQTILSMINTEKEKLDTLSKQAEALFELWKQIPISALEINEDISEKMHTLQGQSQIFSKLLNMISSAKKEILVLGSTKDLSKLVQSEVFDTLSNSTLDVKIVISLTKTIPSYAKMIDIKKIRLLQESPKDDQCFVIKDNEEILMLLRNTTYPSDDIFAIWSDSKALVDSVYKLFDHSWVKGEVVS